MADNNCTPWSLHEDLQEFSKKLERSRSVFENFETTTKEVLQEEKWQELWGGYNLDYVNVLQCTDEYVLKVKEEKEMLMKGIEDCDEKQVIGENLVCNEDILTTEQKNSLRAIDSKINDYIKKSVTYLKYFEVYKRMQELKLGKIEEERKVIEKSIKKNGFKT